MTWTI